jgi:hypothetical protein
MCVRVRVYTHIYIYTRTHAHKGQNNKFQFTFPLALVLFSEGKALIQSGGKLNCVQNIIFKEGKVCLLLGSLGICNKAEPSAEMKGSLCEMLVL